MLQLMHIVICWKHARVRFLFLFLQTKKKCRIIFILKSLTICYFRGIFILDLGRQQEVRTIFFLIQMTVSTVKDEARRPLRAFINMHYHGPFRDLQKVG